MKDIPSTENFEIRYPRFKKKVEVKAEQFKSTRHAYRRICCVPAFALGLVMVSRIQTHYTHAPWFKLNTLDKMLDVYGTVSERALKRPCGARTHTSVSSLFQSSSS